MMREHTSSESTGVTIRPVHPDDFGAVREIYRHYVETSLVTFDEEIPTLHSAQATWSARVEAGFPFIVIEDSAAVVRGFASVHPFREKSAFRLTVELSIYLDPDHTGRGFGALLLGDLLERCRDAGFTTVVAVISDQEAEASLALHRRFGFAEVGRMPRVGEKFGRRVGIIFLLKSLEPATL